MILSGGEFGGTVVEDHGQTVVEIVDDDGVTHRYERRADVFVFVGTE